MRTNLCNFVYKYYIVCNFFYERKSINKNRW